MVTPCHLLICRAHVVVCRTIVVFWEVHSSHDVLSRKPRKPRACVISSLSLIKASKPAACVSLSLSLKSLDWHACVCLRLCQWSLEARAHACFVFIIEIRISDVEGLYIRQRCAETHCLWVGAVYWNCNLFMVLFTRRWFSSRHHNHNKFNMLSSKGNTLE